MNKPQLIDKAKNEKSFFVLFFLSIALIAVFFSPSADDLGWATSQGQVLFENGFRNYNGRYLGNLCAVAFTRIPALLPPVKAFSLTAILFFVSKLSANTPRFSLWSMRLILKISARSTHSVSVSITTYLKTFSFRTNKNRFFIKAQSCPTMSWTVLLTVNRKIKPDKQNEKNKSEKVFAFSDFVFL